ncbi:putative ribonuclease H-like domain-containing protein [Tanacetum coccineum]|uniref:Ribonuclease H-like domain-containing protein n=1 Tax=Tanacetum coccineum TaxID=301880 RepID=A0ABQ5I0I3_9ASTR
MSVFEVRSSDEKITPANDRFSKADGYHAAPPHITRNLLTPRADISFAGLDEYAIRKKIIESKTDTTKFKTSETVGKTNEVNIEKPKSVHESVVSKPKINRDKVIIKDWKSDDEDDVSSVKTVSLVKTNETQTVRNRVDKIGQISQKERIGFKKIKACFVCKRVLTRTGLVNLVRPNGKRAVHTVSTAKPISSARPISTARLLNLSLTFALSHKCVTMKISVLFYDMNAFSLSPSFKLLDVKVSCSLELLDRMDCTVFGFKERCSFWSVENQVNVDAGTQEHYVAGSSDTNKEPTQEYILLSLHPHRPRISVEDVFKLHKKNLLKILLKTMMYMIKTIKKKAAQLYYRMNNLILLGLLVSTSNSTLVSTDNTSYASAACTPLYDLEDESKVFLNDGIFSFGAYDDVDDSPPGKVNSRMILNQQFNKMKIQKASLVQQALVSYIYNQNRTALIRPSETVLLDVFFSQKNLDDISRLDDESLVIKALYGLHQAPRAWYETLSSFLLKNGFRRGTIDKTLFIKKNKSDIIFQMSSMGELTFFLGLQVKQQPDGIFISQDKSLIGSRCHSQKLTHVKCSKKVFRYLKHQPKLGLWYPRDSPFELEAFLDSDYGGASLDRKSTTGGYQFLGRRLISWQCKKQTIVANSTVEVEYVAAANYCQHLVLLGLVCAAQKYFMMEMLFGLGKKMLLGLVLEAINRQSCAARQIVLARQNLVPCQAYWKEFFTNIASAVICLATNQKFNFSKLVFDGMLRNLDTTKKKFLMYPRFLMMFLNNQIELGEPFNDVYPIPAHNLKVFTNMSRKGLKFLGKITPQFPNMLTHAAEGEDSRDTLEGTNGNEGDQVQIPHDSPLSGGHTSDRVKGALNLQELSVLCTNLSNKVLVLESIKDVQTAEISVLKSRIKKLEKKCKPSISHHMAWLKSVKRVSMKKRFRKREFVSKQGRKKSKPESTLDDSTFFNDQDADHEVVEDKGNGDKGGNVEELVSTARPEVSATRPNIDAARQEYSIVEHRTHSTTTSIFDDEDITMAQTLIKMKEEKAKEKGVLIKDVDDSSRPTRSILTLKPLPTIDP